MLYKYRSLDNFERFADIILNSRLYASRFNELNDPMEGYYWTCKRPKNELKDILKEKLSYKICSLSKNPNDILMWTFYANEGRGCCIGLSPCDSSWKDYKIDYAHDLPYFNDILSSENGYDVIKTILTSKLSRWQYEEEIRLMKKTDDNFIPIKIEKIILGYNIAKDTEKCIRELIKLKNNLGQSSIHIHKIKRSDLTLC